MTLLAILTVGFFLGMRHATDVDHVLAVSTFVGREKNMRAAVVVGALWGAGHTLTVLLVGGAIVLFGVVLPVRLGLALELVVALMLVALPVRLGLALELVVALMLVALGVLNLLGSRDEPVRATHQHPHRPALLKRIGGLRAARSFGVGVVHGLAGSAAVELLVLTTIREPFSALAYLLVFGLGTVVGMMLVTSAMAAPMVWSRGQLAAWGHHLGWVTGVLSLAFGLALVYQVGFVEGLFGPAPHWTPQ